jgi:hypothetical protein
MPVRRLTSALLFSGLLAGCRAEQPTPPPAPPPHVAAPRIAKLEALPASLRATESAGIAAARIDGRPILLVADADDRAITTLDATSLTPLSRLALESPPRDLVVLERGVVLATLPEANEVAVLESAGTGGELRLERKVKTSTEPLAMAVSHDGTKIAVTAGAGHRVDLLASDTLSTETSIDVPREPRAILFAANDAVFVTHATQGDVTTLTGIRVPLGIAEGSFNGVDSEPPRQARHAEALVRITGDDGREKILVPLVQNAPRHGAPPGGYGGGSDGFGELMMPMAPPPMPSAFNGAPQGIDDFRIGLRNPKPPPEPQGPPNRMSAFDVRTIDSVDAKTADPEGRALDAGKVPPLVRECLLPRAAVALSPLRVLVACSGDSEAIALDVYAPYPRIVGRYATGRGPTAIARTDDTHAVVWSPLARTVSRFATDEDGHHDPLTKTDLARERDVDPKILAGRELFMRNGDARISKDGLACATCHPDARDDGLVWQTPLGDRRPRTLAGNITRDTAFGWGAEHKTIHSHVTETMKRLRGTGLPKEDLDAIFAYLGSLPAVPLADVPRDPDALRGAQVFASDRAKCIKCHEPENGFTDNKAHVLGFGEVSVTPSLHGAGKRARLFHDGRYDSFEALLDEPPSSEYWGAMGGIGTLTKDEQRDLAAYLRTL